MSKSWIEVRVEVLPSLAEPVSNFLIEQGSPGVVQEKALGPSGRKRERIIAYFPNDRLSKSRGQKVHAYLASLSKPGQTFSVRKRIIREEKWAEAWKSNFKPLYVTPHLVITPPWEDYARKEGEVVIEIDPGMAFGTGTHPTTQMCLQFLEELILSFPHAPSVLDVGTGSGILAIAAEKLGAKKILAVDIDPIAIDYARKNAAANCPNGRIDFQVGSPDGLRRRFDMVIANLLPQELLKIASSLAERISSRGFLVVSGILRGQKREIVSAFRERGLEVWLSRELNGWVGLVLHRRDR